MSHKWINYSALKKLLLNGLIEIKYSRSFGKYMFQLSPFNLQVHYFHDHCPFPVERKNLVVLH